MLIARPSGENLDDFIIRHYDDLSKLRNNQFSSTVFVNHGRGASLAVQCMLELIPGPCARFLGIENNQYLVAQTKARAVCKSHIQILNHSFIQEDLTVEELNTYTHWHTVLPHKAFVVHYFNNHNYLVNTDTLPENSLGACLSSKYQKNTRTVSLYWDKSAACQSSLFCWVMCPT